VTSGERSDLLEEEWLLVRHSGEIPEIALHASLYFLREDNKGPRLQLTAEETEYLETAVLARYQEIILRDLDPGNRDRAVFRGLRRVNHNWRRFFRFCHTTDRSCATFRLTAADALLHYLRVEVIEVGAGERMPSVNCPAVTVQTLAVALGVDPADLPDGWVGLCEQDG
jgi:hypothetical protein